MMFYYFVGSGVPVYAMCFSLSFHKGYPFMAA